MTSDIGASSIETTHEALSLVERPFPTSPDDAFDEVWRRGRTLQANELYAIARVATTSDDATEAAYEIPDLVWTG